MLFAFISSPGMGQNFTGSRANSLQGPKEESTSHFWRMVWHETGPVGVIVMLTQTHESGRDKCFEYFPSSVLKGRIKSKGSPRDRLSPTAEPSDSPNPLHTSPSSPSSPASPPLSPSDSPDCHGNTLHISPIADCADDLDLTAEVLSSTYDTPTRSTLSEIRLTNTQGGTSTSKTIWHYLFSGWPDFLIPEGEDRAALLELVRHTAEKAGGPDNPRVVHCSAGVGRTGTFIALDYLLGELEEGSFHGSDGGEAAGEGESVEGDRVAETVNELRKQRMMMVQGEAQFYFLYEILKEMWERKYGFGGAGDSQSPRADLQS